MTHGIIELSSNFNTTFVWELIVLHKIPSKFAEFVVHAWKFEVWKKKVISFRVKLNIAWR